MSASRGLAIPWKGSLSPVWRGGNRKGCAGHRIPLQIASRAVDGGRIGFSSQLLVDGGVWNHLFVRGCLCIPKELQRCPSVPIIHDGIKTWERFPWMVKHFPQNTILAGHSDLLMKG